MRFRGARSSSKRDLTPQNFLPYRNLAAACRLDPETEARMARKKTEEAKSATLSHEQMRQSVPRLQKRLEELSKLDVASLSEADGDNVLGALVTKINSTLADVFGHGTVEYNQHSLDSLSAMPWAFSTETDISLQARKPRIKTAVASAISDLNSIIDIFKEKLGDDVGGPGAVMRAYEGLSLHKEIARAASKL
jgi:hypothetical protein